MTEDQGRAPVIEYVAPTTAVTIHVPVQKAMSFCDIIKRLLLRAALYTVTFFWIFFHTFPANGTEENLGQ